MVIRRVSTCVLAAALMALTAGRATAAAPSPAPSSPADSAGRAPSGHAPSNSSDPEYAGNAAPAPPAALAPPSQPQERLPLGRGAAHPAGTGDGPAAGT